MSSFCDAESWRVARGEARRLAELDEEFRQGTLPKERQEAYEAVLPFYVKYRHLIKRLTACHDSTVSYQKRNEIKEVLDCAIARMLQYRRDIVNLTFSEYMWPDIIVAMKLTPDDITLTTPAYYTSDRKALLEQREKCIDDLIANANKKEEEEEDEEGEEKKEEKVPEPVRKLSWKTEMKLKVLQEKKAAEEAEAEKKRKLEEASMLVMSWEKTRMARRVLIQKRFERDAEQTKMFERVVDESDMEKAAVVIQRAWRRFRERKATRRKYEEVEELYKTRVSREVRGHELAERDAENYERIAELQRNAVKRYEQIVKDERSQFLKKNGIRMMEDIADEIRNWYLNWYNKLGFFDNFPFAEAGGSALIAKGQTLTPEEYLEGLTNKDIMEEGSEPKTKTKDKKKKKAPPETICSPSEALAGLLKWDKNYQLNWAASEDCNGCHRMDLIREEICFELESEIRKVVDNMIRDELKGLNDALKRDVKLSKGKMSLPKQKKAPKKPKGHKKRKSVHLPDHEVEEQFEWLVLAGVIKKYPRARLRNWIGDLSYQNYDAHRDSSERHPCLGDIGQLVMDYCVLPLGSKRAHQLAPLVRSISIIGLPLYGKKFLAHAVCNETGATLFDLTPQALVGKFETKKELKLLTNAVEHLSKMLAPSVIFVDEGHLPWLKKVPAEMNYVRPKRFAQMLTKLAKDIKPGDQVLFLTTSSEPHKAAAGYVKIHDKFIFVPPTDYSTLYLYYKELLSGYYSVDPAFNVSSLARQSIGCPLPNVREAVEYVLRLERRMKLKFRPLQPEEILQELQPVLNKHTAKAFEAIRKFESKSPLAKQKLRTLANERKELEKEEKKKKEGQQ